jgi:hypothetical protein
LDEFLITNIPPNTTSIDRVSLWLKRHAIAASIIVFACALSTRLFFTLRSDQYSLVKETPDAASYLVPAQNLLKQGSFLNRYDYPEISRTPGYSTFLAGIMLVVGQDWRKVLLTQTILVSFSVLVSFWTAATIFSPAGAFIGALFAALSPWGAVRAGLPLTEGLYLLIISLLFLTLKLSERANRRSSLLASGACVGLLTGAAVMIRPVWPLVLLIAVAIVFLFGPNKKGVWLLLGAVLLFSVTPILLWKERNRQVAHFDGLTDISGETVFYYLASRVTAYVHGQDLWVVKDQAISESRNWKLSNQKADEERWRRADAIFREHPIATVYFLVLNAIEHAINPSPDVLRPPGLNFYGDFWFLGLTWGGLLGLAFISLRSGFNGAKKISHDQRWVYTILAICLLLTFAGGISFGQGSRLRVSLELIIPFMAAEGLLRVIGNVASHDLLRETSGISLKRTTFEAKKNRQS